MNKTLQLLLTIQELGLLRVRQEKAVAGSPAGESPALRRKLDQLRRQVPAPVLSQYDRLAQIHPDVVTTLVGGVCQGCRQPVGGRLAGLILKSDRLLQCEHCGRFIFAAKGVPDYVAVG